MGKPEIGLDQRMSDNAGRVAVQQELDDTIENWTKSLSAQEALAKLDEYSVAAGPIYDARDMMEDPQFKARNLFQNVTINGKEIRFQPSSLTYHVPGQTEFCRF